MIDETLQFDLAAKLLRKYLPADMHAELLQELRADKKIQRER